MVGHIEDLIISVRRPVRGRSARQLDRVAVTLPELHRPRIGDGQYTFPAGLATVEIDHGQDRRSYWEPNVWLVHTLRSPQTG